MEVVVMVLIVDVVSTVVSLTFLMVGKSGLQRSIWVLMITMLA